MEVLLHFWKIYSSRFKLFIYIPLTTITEKIRLIISLLLTYHFLSVFHLAVDQKYSELSRRRNSAHSMRQNYGEHEKLKLTFVINARICFQYWLSLPQLWRILSGHGSMGLASIIAWQRKKRGKNNVDKN